MKHTLICLSVLATLLLSGCVTPESAQQDRNNKAIGAAVGAAVGALAGVATGDGSKERRQRALIGGGIGALTGLAAGAYMDEQERKMREGLKGTGIEIGRKGDDITLNMPSSISFATDQADIRPEFFKALSEAAAILKQYDKTTVDVVGHTDSTGSDAYNQTLSERRAKSVASYLISNGVDTRRVDAVGRGESEPVASNDVESGRAQNRRVELRLQPIVASTSADTATRPN